MTSKKTPCNRVETCQHNVGGFCSLVSPQTFKDEATNSIDCLTFKNKVPE